MTRPREAGGRHLVLVGLMGAGKTTIGRRCAELLGRPLVDTDDLVAKASGLSVPEIFAREGEPGFRAREREAVAVACGGPPAVIACGGGAVLDPVSRARLRADGVVVWLDAPAEVLAARIGDGSARPLLAGGAPPAEVLACLARERRGAYEAAAHLRVDAATDPDAVAAAVLEGFRAAPGRAPGAAWVRVDVAPRPYDVVVGPEAWEVLPAVVGDRRVVAVATEHGLEPLAARAAEILAGAGVAVVHTVIDGGEAAKTLATVEAIARSWASGGLLRGDAAVAVGGGMVGDTVGLAAAVYHRGIDVVQLPTTLLAMVDAAIGGKTAVNLPEGKNLVGAFHHPLAVLADPTVLTTLSEREYRCGLGEVAKYALAGDDALARLLVERAEEVEARDPAVLGEVVVASARAKAAVVAADPEERSGRRALLNYGHTLAHALETLGGYALRHGEAVAVGLVFAAELAVALERVPPAAAEHHRTVLRAVGLPVIAPAGLAAGDLVDLMRRDKKASGGLTFVLLGPNGLELVDDPPPAALARAFAAIGVTP
jgi:shikimate kinase/3-dehydroquinate synthase